jgi:transposase
MAHIIKKIKNGRPYYYIRETARVAGKPRVVTQIYLGTIERILEMATGGKEKPLKILCQEFGSLFVANLMDHEVGIASLVDSVISKGKNESGPSVGEYFLYAVLNRMVDSCSKRALPEWYRGTAIQQIRPVKIDGLDSRRYWDKWDRVKQKDLEKIASRFFDKISRIEPPGSGCFLFDTTNYYTFMASDTESDLAQRGKNKEGRDWLRQVGVALLVSRDNEIPLFYKEYEGNRHDSKLFLRVMEQILSVMKTTCTTDGELTIVFDKGMNSEDNIAAIDAARRVHFITTYSPHYAQELVRVKLSGFTPVDSQKNRELAELGREDDRILAFRTSGEYWGRKRTVVVTYNPLTAAKQRYAFDKKLLELQETLFFLRTRVQSKSSVWKSADKVEKHYHEACEQLHLPKDLYEISLEKENGSPKLLFRKNHYRIGRYIERFGKNILITDHMDWSTDEIVRASLDRYMVEKAFRQSKDEDMVSVLPLRHWTDEKIRCHLLTCVVSLTYLRIMENRLRRAGLNLTAASAMKHLRKLHSCLHWTTSRSKASRLLEEPTEIQSQILRAFGHKIEDGVLRQLAD